MKHIGTVWQDERYDHIIRNEEEFLEKWEYIRQNSVKANLSSTPEQYSFFWQISGKYLIEGAISPTVHEEALLYANILSNHQLRSPPLFPNGILPNLLGYKLL